MLFYPRSSPRAPQPGIGELIPPPTDGWTTATPDSEMPPTTAFLLENFFPQPDYLEIRRGRQRHRPTGTGKPVETLMYWHGPGDTIHSAKMFAAAGGGIYHVTENGTQAPAKEETKPRSFSNARWQWINFTAIDTTFLWACNGADPVQAFDGTDWSQPDIEGIASEDVINVTAHKHRIWMILARSTKAAYLPVKQYQGKASIFPLGGLMTKGGHLVAAGTWSMDGGDGQDDMLVFVTSRGQAIIYKGSDPDSPASFNLIGVYDVGTPLGPRCLAKFGADLALVSVDGVMPISQATVADRPASGPTALTERIHRETNAAAQLYQEHFGWELTVFPRGTKALLNVPIVANKTQVQHVMNTLNGAWCRFNNWNANTWLVFKDHLYYGGNDGAVHEADIPGADEGSIFTAEMRHAWLYYGQRGAERRWTMVQPIIASTTRVEAAIGVDTDFTDNGDINPFGSITPDPNLALWDVANWDEAMWAAENRVCRDWYAVGGYGHIGSVRMKLQIIAPSLSDKTASDRFEFFARLNALNVLTEEGAGFL